MKKEMPKWAIAVVVVALLVLIGWIFQSKVDQDTVGRVVPMGPPPTGGMKPPQATKP